MATLAKNNHQRKQSGTALTEFAAGMVMFFCCFLIPIVDISFVPTRYLLVQTYIEKVAHRMGLSDRRSQAIQYLNSGAWKAEVEKFGVKIKSAKARLLICDQFGNQKLALQDNAPVPPHMLPSAVGIAASKRQPLVYSIELIAQVDIPPLFDSKNGLPGFNKAITFTFRSRDQWENLSPDPLNSEDSTAVKYYINE